MSQPHILVVEDEEDLLAVICYNLIKQGYHTEGVLSGEEGLQKVRTHPPDLILLDLMLTGISGLEVCQQLKKDPATAAIPILMITAKSEDADIVKGFEVGADDYITKPFSPKVLVARVKAFLRRQAQTSQEKQNTAVLELEDLLIHPGRHEVFFQKNPIQLTLSEFRLLYFLAKRPGWAYTRDQIVDAVRGEDYYVTSRSVDVQIVGLRKKLGKAGHCIETVRGIGYRFKG